MAETQTHKIIIVEDNEGLAKLMQINLERSGYVTVIARTAWQARDLIQAMTERVLMLLDYQIGDTPASELLDQLDQMQHPVPFIIITGKGSEQVAVDMMKRGARDYIVKTPDLVDQLAPLVEKVVEEIHREQKRKLYGTPDTHGRQM